MSTITWERLAVAKPVNKQAALVASSSSQSMPKGSPHPRFKIDELPSTFKFRATRPHEKELTGVQYGRMKVIGYIGPQGKGRNAARMWLVRCVCGQYEGRKASTIVKRRDDAMCWDCHHVEQMRRQK